MLLTITQFIILFAFWASLGSFSSALLYRIHAREWGMLTGHSKCPVCERQLMWYHLLPIISYLALGGKCGACGSVIPKRYLFLEIIFGVVFGVIGLLLLTSGHFYALPFGMMLFVIFVLCFLAFYDALYQEVPDVVVVSASLFFFVALCVDVFIPSVFNYLRPLSSSTFLEWMVASIALYSFFALQNIIAGLLYLIREKEFSRIFGVFIGYIVLPFWWTIALFAGEKYADKMFPVLEKYDDLPAWVGGWDLRYAIFLGLTTGIYLGFVSIIFAYILGSFVSIYYLSRGEREKRIALVPFLVSGWVIAMIVFLI